MFQKPFTISYNNCFGKIVGSCLCFLFLPLLINAQKTIAWQNVTTAHGNLPKSVQVFKTTDSLDGKPNIAFYVKAKLKDKHLRFNADTTFQRRLTPQQFYSKNNQPLVVVNSTFFSFSTHQNLNAVIKNGKLVSHNVTTIRNRGKDTLTYLHPFGSAIGITKNRSADIAWLFTDSSKKNAYGMQLPLTAIKDSMATPSLKEMMHQTSIVSGHSGGITPTLKKWKMHTAVGGGPVLLQKGEIKITNEEERKFYGKAINDKHPRTAMGYTSEGDLIILAVQGRFPGVAEGASLIQLAQMLKDLGCVEALNLDGGGSSCLLVNGKETIAPSDKVQRAIPAVFMVDDK